MSYQLYAKKNIPEWISWVYQNQLSLKLTTENLAFLVAIKNWTHPDDEGYLNEEHLHSIYDLIDNIFGGLDETKKQRANSAIKNLIEQRVLSPLSSGTADIESTYNLSSLGDSIVKFFEADETVSEEVLSVMFINIRVILSEVENAAALGGDEQHYKLKIKLQNY
jgi:chromosome condensin MukBEF complex kleisin-like MukF subunit